jgi:glyoxylase-like metal-dependent hydrolase (beta-lactamase superfamily II)
MQDISMLGVEFHSLFHGFLQNLPQYDYLLEEGDTILDTDLTVIHTPGHTPGGISIYSESDLILFSGDTLFFEGVGRTDLPGGNTDLLLQSIREKLFSLPEDTRVFPGHGPYTTIEREKNHNPFLVRS